MFKNSLSQTVLIKDKLLYQNNNRSKNNKAAKYRWSELDS